MRRYNGALPSFKSIVATRSFPNFDEELVRYVYYAYDGAHIEYHWEVTALYATDIDNNRL